MNSLSQNVGVSETKRNTEVSDVGVSQGSSDMLVNRLVYQMPKALSLATGRTYVRQNFQQSSYSGSPSTTMTCVWNTGTSLINLGNSYLCFQVAVTGTGATANFASACGAMALLKEIRIRTRGGVECCRVEALNFWAKTQYRYKYPQDWLNKFGSVIGIGETGIGGTDPAIVSETVTKYCIPLKLLAPWFSPIKEQFLPSTLASGLQVDITLEDYRTALFQKAGTITAYTITNPSFMLDAVDLSEQTQRALNFEAANTGLEWTTEQVYLGQNTLASGQTNLNVQLTKAVAQALICYTTMYTSANLLDVTADSFASPAWDTVSWGYSLGNLHFPNQAITDTAKDGKESYLLAQQVFDKVNHPYQESAVGITDFITNGHAMMGVSLEKQTHLNLSGLPCNNSRSLITNATLDTFSGARTIYTFLHYASVTRSYLDNTAISI